MSSASVMYKLRRILQDFGEVFTAQIAGDGVTTLFELPEDTIEPSSLTVALVPSAGGGTPTGLIQGVDYEVDSFNGILQLIQPPAQGVVVSASGRTYDTWTDQDLYDYVTTAFGLHTSGRNPPVLLDPIPNSAPPTAVLPPVEERLVAILAAKLIREDQATAAAEDITIDTGDGTVIPRSQRYAQLVGEVDRLENQYQNLVSRLGIEGGIDAIQVTNLRRVSMTTNRLVPEYVSREWDNPTYVQRILPAIDTGAPSQGSGSVVTYRGKYNALTQYRLNDEVSDGNHMYLCVNTAGCVGVDPSADVAAGPDGIHGENWQITTINSGMAGYYGGW